MYISHDVLPEGQAAADMVLPKAGLPFMHSHARRLSEEPVAISKPESLVIETMASFMQRRQDRARQIALVNAEGQTHVICTGLQGERMARAVDAAAIKIESDGPKNAPT